MIFYKIRNKHTGLYSKGGTSVVWTKVGKTWDTLGKLRQHLSMHLGKYGEPTDMSDWEIVECETVVKSVKQVHEIVRPEKVMEILAKKSRYGR